MRNLDQLALALAQKPEPFSGRVSFLPISSAIARTEDSSAIAALRDNGQVEIGLLSEIRQGDRETRRQGEVDHASVSLSPCLPVSLSVSPAEQVVTCDHPELADLPAQLLGRTLIVHDLAAARAIAEHTPGFRLLTLQGELLEADGTLTVGNHRGEMGILSRKSELLDLKEQTAQLDLRLVDIDRDLTELREHSDRLDKEIAGRQEEIDALAEQATDLRNRLERRREQRQGLHEEVTLSREEIGRLDEEIVVLDTAWQEARTLAGQAEAQIQLLQARLHQTEESLRLLEQERQQRQEALTTGQVALAKTEERLAGLRARHQQLRATWINVSASSTRAGNR